MVRDGELKVETVSAINDITVKVGVEVELPKTVEVTLNDGKEATEEEEAEEATKLEVAVEWEEADLTKVGEYEVKGKIVLAEDAEFTISEELAAVTVKVNVISEEKNTEEILKEAKEAVEDAEEKLEYAKLNNSTHGGFDQEIMEAEIELKLAENKLNEEIEKVGKEINELKNLISDADESALPHWIEAIEEEIEELQNLVDEYSFTEA